MKYCGISCQQSHWEEHKKHCKSPLADPNWRPAWQVERRVPTWAQGLVAGVYPDALEGKYEPWGTASAIDILNLKHNEGVDTTRDFSLLFAGKATINYQPFDSSRDLRYLVATLASLPSQSHRLLNITLNDPEIAVVSRNLMLLLVALDASQPAQDQDQANTSRAIDTIIHFWYSAFLTDDIMLYLEEKIQPLLEQVRDKIHNADFDTVIKHTWNFSGGSSIQVSLTAQCWKRVLSSLSIPPGLSYDAAVRRLQEITLDGRKSDYRDRCYSKMQNRFFRVAKQRFREDGMLLPFGHSRLEFRRPNPSLFVESRGFYYSDQADPLGGWNIFLSQRTPWVAFNDVYGKLYSFLTDVIGSFLYSLGKNRIALSLFNVDIKELSQHLCNRRYDRIKIANVCGREDINILETFQHFSSHLLYPEQNRHATIITLFINAAKEYGHLSGDMEECVGIHPLLVWYDTYNAFIASGTENPRFQAQMIGTELYPKLEEWFTKLSCLLRIKELPYLTSW
ncbi:hypothetical protein TrVGV298_002779 [Trichoderma virens]|nr:hypothetical protein TrVGV298_002779 [Trichoderma virens]